MTTIKITPELTAERLDAIVTKKIPKVSRNLVQILIKHKKILVNDKPTKAAYRPKVGDVIIVAAEEIDGPSLTASKGNLHIIFEDKNIIAVNKPVGLTVHPAKNSTEITLAHYLLAYYPPIKTVGENPLRPGIVHRLDKLTSGIMVVAKNNDTFQFLKNAWQAGLVVKKYITLIWGKIDDRGRIDTGIARSKRTGKMVAKKEGGRAAITLYKPIKKYTNSTLLAVETKTGRTHQIRAHFKSLGQPVVGDPIYPFRKQAHKTFPRLFLHAHTLTLPLPDKKTGQTFTAPLPLDFTNYLNTLKKRK